MKRIIAVAAAACVVFGCGVAMAKGSSVLPKAWKMNFEADVPKNFLTGGDACTKVTAIMHNLDQPFSYPLEHNKPELSRRERMSGEGQYGDPKDLKNWVEFRVRETCGYNFAVSNIRVTDENAKVNFLRPDHPVLNFPNKITDKDFEGWIQERGIYFAGQADSTYQQVLSMNDPGEQPQKGSLLIGYYGKGTFVYTGLVFFRELPAGVPGAYRLMANIIALNQKKGF